MVISRLNRGNFTGDWHKLVILKRWKGPAIEYKGLFQTYVSSTFPQKVVTAIGSPVMSSSMDWKVRLGNSCRRWWVRGQWSKTCISSFTLPHVHKRFSRGVRDGRPVSTLTEWDPRRSRDVAILSCLVTLAHVYMGCTMRPGLTSMYVVRRLVALVSMLWRWCCSPGAAGSEVVNG